jgi:hypothetical protein
MEAVMSALDYCDIALVDQTDLAIALNVVVAGGHGSVFIFGGTERVRDEVFATLVARGFGSNADAVVVRLWALVAVLQHRRLHQVLLENGHGVLAVMAKVASCQRLNAGRGFNPQKLLLAVLAELACERVQLEPQRFAKAA